MSMRYRATPISATGASPAQLMTRGQIRTTLPMLDEKLQPQHIGYEQVIQQDNKAKEANQFFYSRRHSAHVLPELHPGQSAKVKLMVRRVGKHQPKSWLNLSSQDPMLSELTMEQSTVGIEDIFRLSRGHLPQRHQTYKHSTNVYCAVYNL